MMKRTERSLSELYADDPERADALAFGRKTPASRRGFLGGAGLAAMGAAALLGVAALLHKAIGDQLTCVFVDHGLMRKNEGEQVVATFRDQFSVPLVHVDASEQFLGHLAGVTDPEAKRKIIGKLFIDVFEEEARKVGGAVARNRAKRLLR